MGLPWLSSKTLGAAVLTGLTSVSLGFNSGRRHKVPFLQLWRLGVAVTIEAARGLKGCRAD